MGEFARKLSVGRTQQDACLFSIEAADGIVARGLGQKRSDARAAALVVQRCDDACGLVEDDRVALGSRWTDSPSVDGHGMSRRIDRISEPRDPAVDADGAGRYQRIGFATRAHAAIREIFVETDVSGRRTPTLTSLPLLQTSGAYH